MIVLDTHVWVWYVSNPEELSRNARQAVEREASDEKLVFISVISTWEVALLGSKKRLHLTMNVRDWIAKSEAIPFFHFAPIDNDIALASVFLPEPLHQDPADRITIATALSKGAPLVTKDEKILDCPSVKAIW